MVHAFQRILQSLASLELWNGDRWDLNLFLRGLWVHTGAWLASLREEGAETSNRDFATRLQRHGDNVDKGLEHVFRLLLRYADFLGDAMGKLVLIDLE